MSGLVQRIVSKAFEQIAGSGVGLDDEGRLCLPDGLDPNRAHRFIELVMDRRYGTPKAALHDLFQNVGVAPPAIEALSKLLGDEGHLDWTQIARHPMEFGSATPHFLEIPACIHRFLVDGLGLADASNETLEEAVIATRLRSAERIGCEATWDAILAHPREVHEISRDYRASLA